MDGLERIKVLASEVKDKAVLKIVDYLLSRTDMNEKYLNEEKSLKQMIEFIKSEAQKQEINGVAMIEDEVVFGWAIHYFDEPNEELNLEKAKKEKVERLPKKQPQKVSTPQKEEWKAEGQLTLFDFV